MLFVGGASSPANPINTQRRKATNIERPTSNTEQRSQKSCPSLWAGFSTPRAQLAPSGGHSPPLQQQDTEHEAKDEPQNIQQGISNAEGQQPNSSALWAGLSSPANPTRTRHRNAANTQHPTPNSEVRKAVPLCGRGFQPREPNPHPAAATVRRYSSRTPSTKRKTNRRISNKEHRMSKDSSRTPPLCGRGFLAPRSQPAPSGGHRPPLQKTSSSLIILHSVFNILRFVCISFLVWRGAPTWRVGLQKQRTHFPLLWAGLSRLRVALRRGKPAPRTPQNLP